MHLGSVLALDADRPKIVHYRYAGWQIRRIDSVPDFSNLVLLQMHGHIFNVVIWWHAAVGICTHILSPANTSHWRLQCATQLRYIADTHHDVRSDSGFQYQCRRGKRSGRHSRSLDSGARMLPFTGVGADMCLDEMDALCRSLTTGSSSSEIFRLAPIEVA